MDQVTVTCTDTDRKTQADVMKRNDRRMEVVLAGTNIKLILSRDDHRKPYVGSKLGMEFTTTG